MIGGLKISTSHTEVPINVPYFTKIKWTNLGLTLIGKDWPTAELYGNK